MKFSIIIGLPLILFININLSSCEIFEECDGVADETFVASRSDCRAYIYCTGEDSLSGECDEGQYFDSEASACDDAANVYCALDEVATEAETAAETEIEVATDATTTTTTKTTTTTLSTTTTQAIVATTEITKPTTTEETTTTTTLKTTTAIPIITTISQDSNKVEIFINNPIVRETCPNTDNPGQIVLIANNRSCSAYYICYHGNTIEMHCASHLHFNKATGVCDYPENAHCMQSYAIAEQCLPYVTAFFPHPTNCNYYYYCIRGFLTIQQCPFFYGWDFEKRACVRILKAKCYNNSNYNNSNNKNIHKNYINYY